MRVGLVVALGAIAAAAVLAARGGGDAHPRPSGPTGGGRTRTASVVGRHGVSGVRRQSVARLCPGGGKAASPGCRWYSARSPFNTPIPAHAAVDPGSALMTERMVESLGALYISVRRWSVPVYYAGPSAKRYDIRLSDFGLTAYGVPIPSGARPSAPFPPAQTDGQMVVFDAHTGCEYDFLDARRLTGGGWSAGGVSRLPTASNGIFTRGDSERGSGFALGAGLIRPEELNAGVIRHALVFVLPAQYVRGGGPVHPATESDGESSLSGALPEGARVQLDPSFNVFTLPSGWERIVARALQVYGMYLADRGGGGVGLVAQNPQSYPRNPYPWGAGDYAYLPSALVSHMRVLQLPRQSSQRVEILPSRCAVIR